MILDSLKNKLNKSLTRNCDSLKKEKENYSEGGPLKLERSSSTTYPVTSLLRNTDMIGESLIFSMNDDFVNVLSK